MSDTFENQPKQPTTQEYLAASVDQLIGRLNKNPGNLGSEFPFIQAVLTVKMAQSQERTNRELVAATRWLVWATWGLCLVSLAAAIISAVIVVKYTQS